MGYCINVTDTMGILQSSVIPNPLGVCSLNPLDLTVLGMNPTANGNALLSPVNLLENRNARNRHGTMFCASG